MQILKDLFTEAGSFGHALPRVCKLAAAVVADDQQKNCHCEVRSNLVAMLSVNALALMQIDEIASYLAMTNSYI